MIGLSAEQWLCFSSPAQTDSPQQDFRFQHGALLEIQIERRIKTFVVKRRGV